MPQQEFSGARLIDGDTVVTKNVSGVLVVTEQGALNAISGQIYGLNHSDVPRLINLGEILLELPGGFVIGMFVNRSDGSFIGTGQVEIPDGGD